MPKKLAPVLLAAVLLLALTAAGRSDEHRDTRRHRPILTPTPTATLLPAPTEAPAQPRATDTAAPMPDSPQATPTRVWLCQVCIDVSGTPQWPSACIATQYAGGLCEEPVATQSPPAYP